MRWLSRFALVCYLCLLCTPQAIAVQDLRLSPLSETQLQGLLPNISSYTLDHLAQQDDQPSTGLITSSLTLAKPVLFPASSRLTLWLSSAPFQPHQARAPPLIS
jgi:hypothetical protein